MNFERASAAPCAGASSFFAAMSRRISPTLEHDPEKWIPVFRKDHAPPKI
jgi:hypothetical protein